MGFSIPRINRHDRPACCKGISSTPFVQFAGRQHREGGQIVPVQAENYPSRCRCVGKFVLLELCNREIIKRGEVVRDHLKCGAEQPLGLRKVLRIKLIQSCEKEMFPRIRLSHRPSSILTCHDRQPEP